MQFTLEELEDLLILGESKAIKNDKEFSIDLILKEPDLKDDEEEPAVRTGFKLSYRPEPKQVQIGVSYEVLHESELEIMFRTEKKDKSVEDWHVPTSVFELLEENSDFKSLEFSHLTFDGKTYTNKIAFMQDFGIDELASVTFRIPAIVLTKFKKIVNRKYGTVSDRIRFLIESDLENEIKMAVRKEIFK